MLCEDCPLHCYQIPVVDIVYIRKQHRRHGYGLQMVEDVLNTYPKQNIGFSYKVSDSMLKGKLCALHAISCQVHHFQSFSIFITVQLLESVWFCTVDLKNNKLIFFISFQFSRNTWIPIPNRETTFGRVGEQGLRASGEMCGWWLGGQLYEY